MLNDVYKPTFGNSVFVEWTLIRASRRAQALHPPEIIVVDGFRSEQEAEYFLQQPNTHLIAVIASDSPDEDRQIRFERQHHRRRGAEDSLTMAGFMKDDSVESAWIEPVIHLVKEHGQIIYNNGDLAKLHSQVDHFVTGLGLRA